MGGSLEDRTRQLRAARVPYVHARVVLAEPPTSAKPGAEAVVLPDGTIEGFVGGNCSESTVRAQGLALLDSKESLLLRITPTPEADQPGKLVVHNPCLSGGTLEIFMEPVIPDPTLVVIGTAPVADAVVGIAQHLGYHAVRPLHVDADVMIDVAAVVVASHGRDEETALVAALQANVPYVGLVASRKRGEAVIGSLDMCAGHTSQIHCPAGLDIGARSPGEIALSIMSEIVALRPRPSGRPVPEDAPSTSSATDPVCGMTVAMVDASLHLDRDGERHWFCGTGCLRAFAARPEAYQAS